MTHAVLRSSLALASLAIGSAALFTAAPTVQVAQAAPTATTAAAAPQKTVISATFNSTKRGPVDPTSFRSQVGSTNTDKGAYLGMSYRKDYRGSGNTVRTTLAQGKTIHSTGTGRGNVLMIKLPGSYDSACMSYDVRFSGAVDFSAGGKLPGFVGVAPGTSPTTPAGGGSTAHGFSARLMWLGSKMWKMVRDAHETNLVVTYLYHPGQDREYGDNISWGSSFTPNQWHHVKQCVVMNTVGKANGVLTTYFDNQLVVNEKDVVYRTDPKVHITHFDWSIFRGGDSAVWAGTKTAYVDMDNLKVSAG